MHFFCHSGLRAARSVALSLGGHAVALAVLLFRTADQIPSSRSAAGREVDLILADAPSLELTQLAALKLPEWSPPEWEPAPGAEPVPSIAPPHVELEFADAFRTFVPQEEAFDGADGSSAESRPEAFIHPYWLNLREDMARALQRLPLIRQETNIPIRVLALSDQLLLLSPSTEQSDPIVREVRQALVRILQQSMVPPEDVIGGIVQVNLRLERSVR